MDGGASRCKEFLEMIASALATVLEPARALREVISELRGEVRSFELNSDHDTVVIRFY